MSTASPTFESLGINLTLYQPQFTIDTSASPHIATSSLPGEYLHTFDAYDALSWTSMANGGFHSCTWTITAGMHDIDRWLQEGLGAYVEARDETDTIRWDGRINQIIVTAGGLRWTWGPLTQISNRVGVLYTTIDTSTIPPTQGEQAFRGWEEDRYSQVAYGIATKVMSTGGMRSADAYWIAYSWAHHNTWPKVSQNISLGQRGDRATVQFQALGWKAWLNYPYLNSGGPGTVSIETQVADILDADPNGYFSSDNAEIIAPFVTRPQYDNQYRTAWDLIRSYATLANLNTYRCMAYIGPGRFFKFTSHVPGYSSDARDPTYQISLGEQGHWQVRTYNGALVRPWEVEAGTFAILTDILPGREFLNTITPVWWGEDPRLMFIEKVTFTAPDRIQLQSGSIVDVEEAIKQKGLGQA